MSISPDEYPSQPPQAATHPARKLSWRLLHSLWLAIPIFGFGCLGGVGLIYVGARAGRKSWWIAGIGYVVVASTAFALVGESPEATSALDFYTALFLAAWLACIVHACLINSQWLHWKAMHVPWYERLSPAPASLGTAVPAMSSMPTPVAPPSGGPLDVNTVSVEQLAGLPGFDTARAARTVAEREARGGFASGTDFASAAGLAPHEWVRVRDLVSCPPPQSAPPGPPSGSPGRILDV